jgi:integrase
MAPDREWFWLRALYERLYARAEPVTDKRCRLRLSYELSYLGRHLMDKAEQTGDLRDKQRALLFRDGLIVSLLAHRPFRTRNFATIRIGKELLLAGSRFVVGFDAVETKGRRALEAAIPEILLPYLRRYLDHYRPILLTLQNGKQPPPTDALWVSLWGRPLSPRSLANPINKRTRAAFGTSLPPHWFRHAAGTTIAIDASTNVADAQQVLGHADPGTTEALARSLDAARRFHAVIARIQSIRRGKPPTGAL